METISMNHAPQGLRALTAAKAKAPAAGLPHLLAKSCFGAPLTESDLAPKCQQKEFILQEGLQGLKRGRIKTLLEASFGKKLVDGYFSMPVKGVILEKEYRGVVIVKTLEGYDYMDKLAVVPELQGNGLAKELLVRLRKECKSLIWRASETNLQANSLYLRSSEGTKRVGKWLVYWYGITPRKASSLAPIVAAVPETLIKQ